MRLVAEKLAGERGGETLFSDLDFTVAAGEALLVTGPNGAGKSTLLRIIAGLLARSAGSLRVVEGSENSDEVAPLAHYLGHLNAMKPVLSIEENLEFWRAFNGAGKRSVIAALDKVGLGDIAHLPFGYLSTGQKRRASIARLLVSDRPLWLLDEPTAGLDKASELQFAGLMQEHLGNGGIVIAATHLPLGLEVAGELRLGAST
ncbi:heme ABC exporter ATP-binding protein CcmA [Phyllobacterium sp. SYP-B3895]|uniref:heme ABC exporter ATP-binding protein CcmA n=1 Tax=Phyllobacterium sp. SYP-B3895 TaxID=2663240 RepID=UPI0012996284|nr:heme ABC exporter ATP-binding protein CcmA [Phyllobacterium sp. SYP-B3895]MRG54770.1 heme ABC exporter ATP-binding protein CcmA [Phyllobacterium sp. SYP-B3895]